MAVQTQINEKEMAEKIHEMNENRLWLDKTLDALRKDYSDKYIAVFRKKIVDADPDMKKLIIRIKKEFGNIDTIMIEYISGEDYFLIL